MTNRTTLSSALAVSLAAAVAHADIAARTTVQYDGRLPVTAMGSEVEGSFGEVFIDAAQAGLALAAFLDGSVLAGSQVAEEVEQLLQSASDKWANASVSRRTPNRDGLGGVRSSDVIVVRFEAWSDDDAFGTLRVVTPTNDHLVVTESGRGSRRASATVALHPRLLSPGEYPILFVAKETDCSICLGIVHTVNFTVFEPPTCPTLGPTCAAAVAGWQAANQRRERAEMELWSIRTDSHEALKHWEQRNYTRCSHVHPANREWCLEDVEEDFWQAFSGACPEVAWAVSADVCRRLGGGRQRLEAARRQEDDAASEVRRRNCCCEMNPRGGPGILSIEDVRIAPAVN